jgi:hypothetical protein
MKEFIIVNLKLGFFVSQVMAKHYHNVQELVELSGNLMKNIFFYEQDITNIVGKLTRKSY